MPIEHETKHVLRDHAPLLDTLRAMARRAEAEEVRLHQFYVTAENRFRHTTRIIGTHLDEEFSHTFKLPVGGRLLEVERPVPQSDFDLAREVAKEEVRKIRFRVAAEDAHWDVDFLLTSDGAEGETVYLAMAEAETEEGASFAVPDFLVPHVDYVVPRPRNGEYSNRLLSDPDHARSVAARDGSQLLWGRFSHGLYARTRQPGMAYRILFEARGRVSLEFPVEMGVLHPHGTVESAKAAAQADYDRFLASVATTARP